MSPESLCERCRGLDIAVSYSAIVKYKNGKVLSNLGDVGALAQSNCRLCQFFANVSQTNGILEVYQNFPDISPSRIQLRAITVENLYFPDEDDKSILAGLRKQKQFVFCLVPYDDDVLSQIDRTDWLSIGVILPDLSFTTKLSNKSKKDWMLRTRVIVPDQIPYSLLTEWMSDCRKNHDEHCASSPAINAPCLRVIDCKTLEIIKTPQRCEYIALSYVWGSTQARGPGPVSGNDGAGSKTLKMPEEMALVVTDAMQVVLQLGYRFLWIDKYCIDQENASEKASQIADMGSIYRSSIVVIVAAGGIDSSFGLPGVSTRFRTPQPSIEIQGQTWLSTTMHPTHAIRKSGWVTRGWTFQEAVFSRRRLYFTEYQVAFECESDGNIQTEALHLPRNVSVNESWCPSSVFEAVLAEWPLEGGLAYIAPQIEEYSSRDLTCESDALNAFRSFYTQMEKKSRAVYQFFGLPIVRQEDTRWDWQSSSHSDSDSDNDSDDSDEDSNDANDDNNDDLDGNGTDDREDDSNESDGTGDEDDGQQNSTTSGGSSTIETEFDPVDSLVSALCWHHASIADNVENDPRRYPAIRRRRMFPSWSWLGWTGRVSYEESMDLDPEPRPVSNGEDNNDKDNPLAAAAETKADTEIEFHMEDKQGCLWPWKTWDDVQKICRLDSSNQLSGRLLVKGYFEDVKIRHEDEDIYVDRSGYKRKAELYMSKESSSAELGRGQGDAQMNGTQEQDNNKSWRFLSLGRAFMLVMQVSEGTHSRVGIAIPQKLKTDIISSSRNPARRKSVQLWLV